MRYRSQSCEPWLHCSLEDYVPVLTVKLSGNMVSRFATATPLYTVLHPSAQVASFCLLYRGKQRQYKQQTQLHRLTLLPSALNFHSRILTSCASQVDHGALWRLASEVVALGSHCMLRNLDLSQCSLPRGLLGSACHSLPLNTTQQNNISYH